MEQKQRLDYLVEKFKEDSGEYSDLVVPDSEPEKRKILRSLMNIRMPRHLDAEVQEVQDAFLQEDAREKGIVTLDQIPTVKDSCNSRDVFAEKSLSGRETLPDFRWELLSMLQTPRCWGVLFHAIDVLTMRYTLRPE